MTDEFEDLKSAFDAATPAPDAARRAANLRLAQENFARLQGSGDAARPIEEPRKIGVFAKGVRKMFDALSSKAGLTATTALAAFGLFMVVPALRDAQLPEMAPEPAVLSQEEMTDSIAMPDVAEAPMMELAPAPQAMPKAAARMRQVSPVAGLVASDSTFARVEDAEVFANEEQSGIKVVAEDPVSTFSVDVDTASYSIVRSSLMAGYLPPKEAVRVEEMINYFPYGYAPPARDAFAASLAMMPTPWNEGTQLLRVALQGKIPVVDERPPLNLVFLIDTSGSMNQRDKLPLLKQSLRLMLGKLRAEDQVAIVAYAGSAGQVLKPTSASEREPILAALEKLDAGGSTNGQEGLQQAYALAAQMGGEGEVSRVLLATDGDFNVGLSDPSALKDYIADKRESGTYLSVLGFGRGNLDDATMQALAQNGNGQAAYIDSLPEAQKVLVDQFAGALFPIASDVKVQVEFNPAVVAEYRLIGYETRALQREDFNNDAVDAGDIGAGHQVTALYEITPVGSDARLTDALRYGSDVGDGAPDEIGFLKLRSKAPGAADSALTEIVIPTNLTGDEDLQFAAAIAGFGETLRGSHYLGGWSLDDAISLGSGARGTDAFGYRAEALQLMRLAQSLSE